MPVALGLDLGTTSLSALALDVSSGDVLARSTIAHQADCTSPADRQLGLSEWDALRIGEQACACLRAVASQLAQQGTTPAALALTGQQHGVLLVNGASEPLLPLIGWQDRRGEQPCPGTGRTFTQEAAARVGASAPVRTGCRLATGYQAVTLFWLKEHGRLPPAARACFLTDWFAGLLTGCSFVTDPTFAGSSGVYDIAAGAWADDQIEALGLPLSLFPEVRPAGTFLGELRADLAERTGLPRGLPIFVGLGDNQASFVGSVARPEESVLVNVGTGGQVAILVETFRHDPALETRPYPGAGYLLVCPGLSGGRVYALLESFFRQTGRELFGATGEGAIYEVMNRLAASVPPGCDGLSCEPYFAGTRAEPELRGSWSGVSMRNWTPGHVTRALLEGMARAFHDGLGRLAEHMDRPRAQLIGAGNGMRENPLLRTIVSKEFGQPLRTPKHREEAAFGAALVAATGAGFCPDLQTAAGLIHYEKSE